VSEELSLTMKALRELYRARRAMGWGLQVYDYTSNTWREGDEAFTTPGTYERAVLTGPGMRPIRVRVLPTAVGGLSLDAGCVREMGVWRALGIDLKGRHLDLVGSLVEGHSGHVSVEELVELLMASDDPLAREVLVALAPLVPSGGGQR
jgi:hypothetical protein